MLRLYALPPRRTRRCGTRWTSATSCATTPPTSPGTRARCRATSTAPSRSCARGCRRSAKACRCWSTRPTSPTCSRASAAISTSASFSILDAKIHTTQQRLRARHLPGHQPACSPEHYRDLISLVETELRAARSTQPARCPSRAAAACRAACEVFPITPRVDAAARRDAPSAGCSAISASDRVGLLYSIARVLARHQHQPAAGQDHHAGRAGGRHLPDRRRRSCSRTGRSCRSRPNCSTRSRLTPCR